MPRTLSLTSRRFNGAASSCSRKYLRLADHQLSQLASMGPRAAARGNLNRGAYRAPAWLLQWGREQLLAEIRKIEAAGRALTSASMGPRAAARGNSYFPIIFNFQ